MTSEQIEKSGIVFTIRLAGSSFPGKLDVNGMVVGKQFFEEFFGKGEFDRVMKAVEERHGPV